MCFIKANGSARPTTIRGCLLGDGTPSQLNSRLPKALRHQQKVEKRYGYHKRSLSEIAMYRVKLLLGGKLILRNYNAQVGETYATIKALNKLTELGMPETQCAV